MIFYMKYFIIGDYIIQTNLFLKVEIKINDL